VITDNSLCIVKAVEKFSTRCVLNFIFNTFQLSEEERKPTNVSAIYLSIVLVGVLVSERRVMSAKNMREFNCQSSVANFFLVLVWVRWICILQREHL
jgi:hypothetical protein